jgi:uncharacterized cupredoxin-like copper-binding protein
MTRTFKILVAVTALVVLVLFVGENTQASDAPQLVSVTLHDYSVNLSQFVVSPGKNVRFVVDNEGMLPHQLLVQSLSEASPVAAVDAPVIAPGTTRTLQYQFKPGIYRLVCDEADHAEKGMVNVFAADATPPATPTIPTNILIPMLAFGLGCILIIGHSLGLSLIRSSSR